MKKFLHITLTAISLFFTTSLVLSYLSVYISPDSWWIPAFFGLAYPFLLIINLIFLVYWIVRKRKKLYIINIFVIILGVSYFTDFFQFRFQSDEYKETDSSIKVMTYNVKLFNLYNWKNNKNIRDEIFDIMNEEQADILCLQEFYKENSNAFNTLDTLIDFLPSKNYHEEYSKTISGQYHFGIATFSKYPIIDKGKFVFKGSDNICIYTDILINNDTLRIYNNHLESIRFDEHDYNFIDSIELKIDDKRIKGIKTITKRLKDAYIKRALQVDTISDHIKNCPYSVIVCGDFNDTPISYAYHKIKNLLKDSFIESGSGIGSTYSGNLPSLRIDYIFHSKNLESVYFKKIKKDFSDHYPIVSVLDYKE